SGGEHGVRARDPKGRPRKQAPHRRGIEADPRRPRPRLDPRLGGARVTHPALRTRLCELLGVEHPIVQTGMGWVAGPRLVAATSNAGGLGILASATMDLRQLKAAIAETRERAPGKPIGVNLRSAAPDAAARVPLLINEGV